MFYLLPTKHESQHDGLGSDKAARLELIHLLEKVVKKYKPTLIAEEFSQQALKMSGATVSTAQYIAQQCDPQIRHLFCDPDQEERKNIGIPSRMEIKNILNIQGAIYADSKDDKLIETEQKKYHSKRENFWFDKIHKYRHEKIIFICGSDHLSGFTSLLAKESCMTAIISSEDII